jgi:hypothetical protein
MIAGRDGMLESVARNTTASADGVWGAFPLEDFGGEVRTGTDPEVFVKKGGEVVPAFEFLPSKQQIRRKYQSFARWGRAFWDGWQAEFTVKDRVCLEELTSGVRRALTGLALQAGEFGGELVSDDVVEVTPEALEGASEEHRAFGCAPSLNAYGVPAARPEAQSLVWRSAGCHLHFGVQRPNEREEMASWVGGLSDDEASRVVRAMDRVAGVFEVAMLGEVEHPMRRMWYGRAGEYRKPKYGVEWRVPSARVMSHPALFILMCDLARVALKIELLEPGFVEQLWVGSDAEVQDIINGGDVRGARAMLGRNVGMMRAVLRSVYDQKAATAAMVLAENGAKKCGYLKRGVADAWNLNLGGKFDPFDDDGDYESDIASCEERWTAFHNSYRWRSQVSTDGLMTRFMAPKAPRKAYSPRVLAKAMELVEVAG